MTSGEARKLLGGYAARTLTGDERVALFEAALNDQELFEELIHEQAMQEVMDDPVSRAGLLAALDAAKHKRRWWVPAGALAVAACLAVAFLWTWNNRPPAQIAALKSDRAAPAMMSAPAPPPAQDKVLPRARNAAQAIPAHAPPISPGLVSTMVEVQAEALRARATLAAALAPIRLTLMQAGAIHAGDEVRVTATTQSGGFLYVYEREAEGPWTLLGDPGGLAMTQGQMRLLPAIHIPDGVARVTLLAFLTPEQNSPPKPDQAVPDGFKTELVLDVAAKQLQ
jgi:hypothetical protein